MGKLKVIWVLNFGFTFGKILSVGIYGVFNKLKREFAPHSLVLDDWERLQFITLDNKRIGVISAQFSNKWAEFGLPVIYYEKHKMRRSKYEKYISKRIAFLIRDHIQMKKEEARKLAERKKAEEKAKFQNDCAEHLEQLQSDGIIDYDKLKNSKSTESVYAYKGKKRILRISTHPSYIKNLENSIIIKPDEIEKIDIIIGGGEGTITQ
jgi:hypothetical protein